MNKIGDSSLLITTQIAQEARRSMPVVVYGETGTGKEQTARAIHELSSRKNKPFVTANIGGLDADLASSELFGHTKGAFTGAINSRDGLFLEANGGTLFLDEIGDMAPLVQVKLLRALASQEIRKLGESKTRKIDVRIVAATHADLSEAVSKGDFRQDLFFRLRANQPLELPTLTERSDEDIQSIWEKLCEDKGLTKGPKLVGDDFEAVRKFPWPGNIRELRWEAIEYCRIVEYDPALAELYSLEDHLSDYEQEDEKIELSGRPIIDDILDSLQRALLNDMVEQCGGDISRAAKRAGLRPATLRKRVERLRKRLPDGE